MKMTNVLAIPHQIQQIVVVVDVIVDVIVDVDVVVEQNTRGYQ